MKGRASTTTTLFDNTCWFRLHILVFVCLAREHLNRSSAVAKNTIDDAD